MLKKRIISSSVAMALTASVAMLSGCPTGSNTPVPSGSASASASASPSETSSASVEPTSTASTSPSSSGSASANPSATPSNVTPTSATGTTPDIEKKATVDGKVLDKKGFAVDGATVTLSLLDPGVKFADGSTSLSTKTAQGSYVFRDVPTGTRIELKASKEGWTTQTRVESVKSNLEGNTGINKFNFGAEGVAKGIYALQDEPQIETVKVNGSTLDKFGSSYVLVAAPANPPAADLVASGPFTSDADMTNGNTYDNGPVRPKNDATGALTNLKPELTFDLMFTEPVKQTSVQNAFRVYSEPTQNARVPVSFELTESAFDWTWSSDGKSVTLKSKKSLLQENSGNQMRYRVTFNQAFEDTQGVSAEAGSFMKFGISTENDYFTVALENDTSDPRLLRAEYNDTGVVDQVTLTFSEPFDVFGRRVPQVLLFNSYAMVKNGVAFATAPAKIELSSDGRSVRMEWGNNNQFVKDDVVSVAVNAALKDPAGRDFSTAETGDVENVATSDKLKVFKVIN